MPYHDAKHRRPVTDAMRRGVTDELPEIADIEDPGLRKGAVEAWVYALACSESASVDWIADRLPGSPGHRSRHQTG
jgi:hypothetical protein